MYHMDFHMHQKCMWYWYVGCFKTCGLSKFFGPSPRKQWLTVYRGFQVYDLDFHQGTSLYIHCAWRATCRGASFFEKITRFSRKIKNFSNKAALRVPLAVTRLTVYRQLHIMRPGRSIALWEQTYLWQVGSSNASCSGYWHGSKNLLQRVMLRSTLLPVTGDRQIA